MLVDTHCHLGDAAFDPDRDAVVTRATRAGVGHVVVIAESVPSTDRARAIAQAHGLSATAGVHPHEASSWNPATASRIREALDAPVVVAVGETGLDYHYDHAPRPAQRAAFDAQLRLAVDRGLPVVVHAREADDDLAAALRALGPAAPAIILHSFSSGHAAYDAGRSVDAYFGWSGMVTFRNWSLDAQLRECPADRILLETDAPYLAPVPHRGTRNEPAHVRHVAARVAAVRGVPLETLADLTTANAGRCFGARVTDTSTLLS